MHDSSPDSFISERRHLSRQTFGYLALAVAVLLGLYLASLYSYLLFHSLAEIFSIVVAFGIFLIAWNSRRFLDNNYLLLIGISYFFVGFVDLIHTLAYKGMGVFPGTDANLSTQLWIAARGLESGSLLIAPFFVSRTLRPYAAFAAFAVISAMLFGTIFYWKIFPDCYLEGTGLTGFKITAEYVICAALLASLALLLRIRDHFDKHVLRLLVWSIAFTIASELAFTRYVGVYGFANLVGHYFKIISFYLMYRAIIETGFSKPYDLLFRELAQKEAALERERDFISAILDTTAALVAVSDRYGKIVRCNLACQKMTGYTLDEVRERTLFDLFATSRQDPSGKEFFDRILLDRPTNECENALVSKDGKTRFISWTGTVLRSDRNDVEYIVATGVDITERQLAEEALRLCKADLEMEVAERTAELREANEQLQSDLTERKRAESIMSARLRLVEYSASHSLDELLQATLDEAEVLTGSWIGFYHFVEADQRTLWLQAWSTRTLREFCTAEGKGLHYDVDKAGVWVDCFHERRPVIHNDYSTLPHRKGMPAGHAKVVRELVVPVIRSDSIVAILGVGNKPVDYDAKDIETVSLIADLAWDVTERKRTEAELKRSNDLLLAIIAAAPAPIIGLDLDGNVQMVWNPAAEKLLGWSAQEAMGRPLPTVPADKQDEFRGFRERIRSGMTMDGVEVRRQKRDGSLIDYSIYASPLHDAEGRVAGNIAILVDITDRKLAEDRLRESEELHRLTISNISDTVFITDDMGDFTFVCPNTLLIFGYSQEEVEALGNVDKLLGHDLFDPLRLAEDREIQNIEWSITDKSGREHFILVNVKQVSIKGGTVLYTCRDITDRKRAQEELNRYRIHLEDLVKERTRDLQDRTRELEIANSRLQEADRLKSVFLASMSHELRTPLNSIIGFTGIMLMGMTGELTEEQKRQLTMVKNSANHLLGLINDVLDIAKIEAGKVTLSLERFDIGEVMDSVIETVAPMAAAKGLEVVRKAPSGLVVASDKRRVKQILMNIMGNAVKFTERGNITISAAVSSKEKLVFRVTDTGIGIKEEDMRNLFFPFHQVDTTLTKAYEGTGLGLYLCRRLAVLLGGDITASSTYGKGSEFTVVLPLSYGGPHEKDIGG